MSNNDAFAHQWIVLDGDIDAEWIESMNTVMDDNKMLTLASNERIPLTATMRLLLEINHMIHCSPAVSRGGVIYVNETDMGVQPVIDSGLPLKLPPTTRASCQRFRQVSRRVSGFCRRNFRTMFPVGVSRPKVFARFWRALSEKENAKTRPSVDGTPFRLRVHLGHWRRHAC